MLFPYELKYNNINTIKMITFTSKKEKDNSDYSLFDKYFDRCDIEEDQSLYKNQLYILEEDKFTKIDQSTLTLKHKSLLNRLILDDYSVYPPKKDPMNPSEISKIEEKRKKKVQSDEKDSKKFDDLEKYAEDENEFIKDLHRINYLTFSPFSLSFFNNNESSSKDNNITNEKLLKEKENENKLFKMIKFDYNRYEFNEDLLFNICHGFVDPDKLREENMVGYQSGGTKKNSEKIMDSNKNLEEKIELEEMDPEVKLQKEEEEKKKEEEKKQEEIKSEINRIIKEIYELIKKIANIDFFQEEIKKFNVANKKVGENDDIAIEDKMIFYQQWLDKFHEIENVYNNHRVQIQRTETIKREREEKKKKEEEKERLKKIDEQKQFEEELNKIRESALQRKKLEEKGKINMSDSINKKITSNSGFSNNLNMKVNNKSKKTNINNKGKFNKKKKENKSERSDWMYKKSDNYFNDL